MTLSESIELFNNFTAQKYPTWVYQFSSAKLSHFRRIQMNGGSWESAICDSLDHIAKLQNFGIYWYNLGIRDNLLIELYKSDKNWNVCKICGKIYNKKHASSKDFKAATTCSDECNTISRLNGNAKLSESKKLYNSRDPEQYAKRHNITIEEANSIVNSLVRTTSHRCVEYWMKKGYSIEESKEIISNRQKKNSKRSVEYWLKLGFSIEQAKLELSKEQHYYTKFRKEFKQEDLWTCIEYYIKRGYSVEEGLALKNKKLKENGETISKVMQSKSIEERRENVITHISFYTKRGYSIEEGIVKLKETFEKLRSSLYVSKISIEFCQKLDKFYVGDKIYHDSINSEFFIFSKENKKMYRYDFTNTTKKFIVEFNGNYWHSELNNYWSQELDDAKIKAAENSGFKVFTIWEKTYKENKDECVLNLVNEIKEWYENCKN
jgi:very-short-patch-repair endonuclease